MFTAIPIIHHARRYALWGWEFLSAPFREVTSPRQLVEFWRVMLIIAPWHPPARSAAVARYIIALAERGL